MEILQLQDSDMDEDIFRSQFRLPYSLYEHLKKQAQANNRSLNAEIVARLQRSLEADDVLGGDALDTAAYQAMAGFVLSKNMDHSHLSGDQELILSQLTSIGEKIISRMQFIDGDGPYMTRVKPEPK